MEYREVLEALRSLSPRKQAAVLEAFPGAAWKTAQGFEVSVRSGKELGRFRNTPDARLLEWIRNFEAGDVFYDIGANCGGVTFAAAAIHGDKIRIVSIEPSFASFESLAR